MARSHPKEYLTLVADENENYSEIYDKRLVTTLSLKIFALVECIIYVAVTELICKTNERTSSYLEVKVEPGSVSLVELRVA